MQIAIIGTGNVGKALATSLGRAGHDITLAARDADKTAETATALGVKSAETAREAAEDAEIVILAVPADALATVAQELAETVDGKPVVDVSNQMQPDPSKPSNAEKLQEKLGNAPVVKAFNTAFASRQANPEVDGVPADGYVAADDPDAKQRVLEVVESAGFTPIDAGPLSASRTLEGMAWINISRNMQGGSWQSAYVLLEPKKTGGTH